MATGMRGNREWRGEREKREGEEGQIARRGQDTAASVATCSAGATRSGTCPVVRYESFRGQSEEASSRIVRPEEGHRQRECRSVFMQSTS